MVLSPSPLGPIPEERKSVPPLLNVNPRGNGTIPGRQNLLSRFVQRSGQRHDRAGTSQSDVITPVGSERTPPGFNCAIGPVSLTTLPCRSSASTRSLPLLRKSSSFF